MTVKIFITVFHVDATILQTGEILYQFIDCHDQSVRTSSFVGLPVSDVKGEMVQSHNEDPHLITFFVFLPELMDIHLCSA